MRSVVSKGGMPGRRKSLLIMLAVLAALPVLAGVKYFYRPEVDRIIVSSNGFPSAVNIEEKGEIQNFLQGLDDSVAGDSGEKSYRNAKFEFSIYRGAKQEKYLFNDHLSYFEPVEKKQYLASPRLKEILYSAIREMEQANPYGEFMDWKEVKKIFPRNTDAIVTDMETGLKFKVQRRAGSQHADVQPLTADDTAVMKEIFDGQWTWRRRAIIVEVGGRRLAGSMNGMPHGAGAIYGNDFPGHFCIHFRNSRVHGSGEADLAHQMMVWKAAGKTEAMLRQAGPEEIMWTFFTAIEQREYKLAASLTDGSRPGENLEKLFRDIIWLNVSLTVPAREAPKGEAAPKKFGNRVELHLKISWQDKKTGQHQNLPVTVAMVRSGKVFPWLIARDSIKPFLP